jgi:hypothetical protein
MVPFLAVFDIETPGAEIKPPLVFPGPIYPARKNPNLEGLSKNLTHYILTFLTSFF